MEDTASQMNTYQNILNSFNIRMNQIHQINANNCKENVNNSCCTLSRRKGNSFSRQILRHGRCDGKDRNPDQINPELSKAAVDSITVFVSKLP